MAPVSPQIAMDLPSDDQLKIAPVGTGGPPSSGKTCWAGGALPGSGAHALSHRPSGETSPMTHLLQFATQSGGNLLIPHKAMTLAAKSLRDAVSRKLLKTSLVIRN